MKTIIVTQGQSLVDIALQEYGSVEGVFQLCKDNNLDVGSDVEKGTILQIDETAIINKKVVDFYQKQGITPATMQQNVKS